MLVTDKPLDVDGFHLLAYLRGKDTYVLPICDSNQIILSFMIIKAPLRLNHLF